MIGSHRITSPRARAALLVLLAAGVLAACGSDDTPSGSDPDGARLNQDESGGGSRARSEDDVDAGEGGASGARGPGKAAFVHFVDRVCTRFRRAAAETGGDPTVRARRLADLVGDAVTELSGPPVPRRDAAVFRDYLALLGDQRDLLGELAGAVARGDRRAVASIGRRVADVGRRARSRARAYGLRVCGSS